LCPSADVGRYHFLDCFWLNLELLETREVPARNIIRLEKVNLARGERWVWQKLEQPRLDFGYRKRNGQEQSPFAHEV
jgi:hypothetical protein